MKPSKIQFLKDGLVVAERDCTEEPERVLCGHEWHSGIDFDRTPIDAIDCSEFLFEIAYTNHNEAVITEETITEWTDVYGEPVGYTVGWKMQ